MILEASGVTVRYAGTAAAALLEASCSVDATRLVAVVGPNGSGKTTLVRAVSGLSPVAAGEIRIDGRPVSRWPRGELAQVLAVVSQREESVFPLSVEETVMLGRYARIGPFAAPSERDRDAVRQALDRCDVADLAHRPVDALSGGEWQRVRIARALAQEPRLLVLDEPTASLDVRHEMELFELVRKLVDGGLAGLVITHHLNLAARYADRMLLLNGGRVVAEGTPAEVLRKDVLRRVFEWPIAVTTWCDGSPQVVPLRPGELEE
ncbi:MAG: ABC transporter ATP-binding protein [Gemmatimonadales bacterium]|nr:ABC transporter ATP-binding protein [Gemmatimonadales bacterium]MBA3556043.1 ABC transporter ATP-binding protein [Gemmatimonadales bacterium]